jgi:hypothetical protein
MAWSRYDPALRTLGDVEAADGATFEVPDSAAGHVIAERAGTARFSLLGEALSLSVFWLLDYAGGFFVSYRDATSGNETYGAGRASDLGLQFRVSAVMQLRPAVELSAPTPGELADHSRPGGGAIPRLIAVTAQPRLLPFSPITLLPEAEVCESLSRE